MALVANGMGVLRKSPADPAPPAWDQMPCLRMTMRNRIAVLGD